MRGTIETEPVVDEPRFRTTAEPQRLIVFTRYPTPGEAKTRLIPALGARGAARLHQEMTQETLEWVEQLADSSSIAAEVHFQGGSEELMKRMFDCDLPFRRQCHGGLGQRMDWAFHDAFYTGAELVVLVGVDCPELSASVVQTAFARLRNNDVVIGPAGDGGYYLIGLSRETPELFVGIPWGSSRVFDATLKRIAELNLSVALLDRLDDVDRPEDLRVWNRTGSVAASGVAAAKISVIIPTLNDDERLEQALRSTRQGHHIEVIVVDGGDSESTRGICRRHGALVLTSPPGRGLQMNVGAAAAEGEILLFLHADTRLPEDFDRQVRQTLARPGVAAGAFQLRIEQASGTLRFIEGVANIRARAMRMPYGDQAIFLLKKTFERLDGYAEEPILEDVDLVRRLRQTGQIAIADSCVTTSRRRWDRLGPWRTSLTNQLIVGGYYLGLSPKRLARWYGRK